MRKPSMPSLNRLPWASFDLRAETPIETWKAQTGPGRLGRFESFLGNLEKPQTEDEADALR